MRSYCVERRIENVLDAEIIAFEELSITLAPTVCVPLSIFVIEALFPEPFDSSFPSIVIKILCPIKVSFIYKPHHNPPQRGEEIPFLMFIGPPHTSWHELKLKRF